jgi:hypothetical protein
MQVCVFSKTKTDKRKGEIKTKTVKKKKTKEKYVHSIQRVVIKQNIYSGLGHSPDRCQAALPDSATGKSWDPISQQLKTV